jgi:hypothetical protein
MTDQLKDPCSICKSYSQINLCHYTLQRNSFEFNFVHLRYSLGGYRPSQTTRYNLSHFIEIVSFLLFQRWYFTNV